jgi:hypothetical protein
MWNQLLKLQLPRLAGSAIHVPFSTHNFLCCDQRTVTISYVQPYRLISLHPQALQSVLGPSGPFLHSGETIVLQCVQTFDSED